MAAQTDAVEFLAFDNSYARLPDRFFARLRPTPIAAPRLVKLNEDLARQLGLDPDKLATAEGVEVLESALRALRGSTSVRALRRSAGA